MDTELFLFKLHNTCFDLMMIVLIFVFVRIIIKIVLEFGRFLVPGIAVYSIFVYIQDNMTVGEIAEMYLRGIQNVTELAFTFIHGTNETGAEWDEKGFEDPPVIDN